MYKLPPTSYQRKGVPCQLLVYALILYCCTSHAYGDRTFKMTALNRKLDQEYWIKSIKDTTLNRCADMCVYVTDCQSVSYSVTSKKCELYSINSTSAAVDDYVMANSTALMDISNWIQERTGGCWEKPCAQHTVCTPHKQLATCIPYGCAPYKTPDHGRLFYSEEFVRVGHFILAGCNWPYMTTQGNPKIFWNKYCLGNGEWGTTYECVTVEELCTHHILEPLYYNLTITVTDQNQWDTRQTLFSSTSGWTSSNGCESGDYVQVTFEQKVWIGGVATKGAVLNWVTGYKVAHSSDCISYTTHRYSNGTDMVYKGNEDVDSIHRNFFDEALEVMCVRVIPFNVINGCAMRLEILTCKDHSIID